MKTASARTANARLRTQATRRVLSQNHHTPTKPITSGPICHSFHPQWVKPTSPGSATVVFAVHAKMANMMNAAAARAAIASRSRGAKGLNTVERLRFVAAFCRTVNCQNQDLRDFWIDRIETVSLWNILNPVHHQILTILILTVPSYQLTSPGFWARQPSSEGNTVSISTRPRSPSNMCSTAERQAT